VSSHDSRSRAYCCARVLKSQSFSSGVRSEGGPCRSVTHQLKQHQGVWYKDGRQVVTGDVTAKRHIIKSHHDSPVHGHPGISKTIQLTERLYWWPRMRIDITEYVKGCADCQRHKVNTRPTKAPLQPIYPKAETTPFETVALDFIVKLPISQGFDSILTVTDQGCTKAAIFIPCNEDITAEETAALYIKHVFCYGWSAVVCDVHVVG
jgi:hypothetical protein